MRDLKNKLISNKNTKNIKPRRGKMFGYQTLGFGAGALPKEPYSADFLVIAGGGGAGYSRSGGGGAGGYRNSYSSESSGRNASSESSLTLSGNTTYTITVGGGGGGSPGDFTADSGNDSSIAGSDITNIVSTAG